MAELKGPVVHHLKASLSIKKDLGIATYSIEMYLKSSILKSTLLINLWRLNKVPYKQNILLDI